jgi:hypothetical protein
MEPAARDTYRDSLPNQTEVKAYDLWNIYRAGANSTAHDGTPLKEWRELDARAQDGWKMVASHILETTGTEGV